MKKLLYTLIAGIVLGLVLLASVIYKQQSPTPTGADNVTLFGGQLYYLYGGGISSSATSIQLTSLTIPQNGYEIQDSDLSATFYVTIEPGSRTRQEFASCTTVTQNSDNTATISGCVRGLSPIASYAASTTLQFAHSGGSRIIFSDPPQVYNQFTAKTNDETISGIWDFSSTSVPRYDLVPSNHNSGSVVSTTSEFASVAYVNATGAGTQVSATEAIRGEVELATALESASSTILGGSGAPVVQQARYATDTPQSGCAAGYTSTAGAGCGVVAQLTGKIRQAWLSLTEAFTWTAVHTFTAGIVSNASTTIAATSANPLNLAGLNFNIYGTRAASSTVLTEDASGNLRFLTPSTVTLYSSNVLVTTLAAASTTLVSVTIPANTLTTRNSLKITARVFSRTTSGNDYWDVMFGNGVSSTTIAATTGGSGARHSIEALVMSTTTTAQVGRTHIFSDDVSSYGNTLTVKGWSNNNLSYNTASTLFLQFRGFAGASGEPGFDSILVETVGN